MPNVITLLETIETEKSPYDQESIAPDMVPQPVSRSRFSRLLGFLRVCLRPQNDAVGGPQSQRFESGLDMLSQKHPYLFIRTLCG